MSSNHIIESNCCDAAYNVQEIAALLHAKGVAWIRQPQYFDSIESSNSFLLNSPESLHGQLVITDFQSAGKGRRGKRWQSEKGASLMFSLGWVPVGPLQAELSLVVGLALADALVDAGAGGISLKWPNDVLYEEAKLAGILIEVRSGGEHTEVVIGIGLNIKQSADGLKEVDRPWTDLSQLGLRQVNRQDLLIDVLLKLSLRLEQFEIHGFECVRRDWLKYHAYQGKYVSFFYRGAARKGRVVGLDKQGALLLEADGEVVAVNSGEVNGLRTTV